MKLISVIRKLNIRFISVLALGVFIVAPSFAANDVVNVYSARKEALILPILEKFRDETGIEFNLVTGKADALLTRLVSEGEASTTDVFITVDAGRLHRAKEAGVLQPLNNQNVESSVRGSLRDPDGTWTALSLRARPIFYAKDRVDPSKIATYEDLVNSEWQSRICIRSSGNIYNQSLVASMIVANGMEQTDSWAMGMVANFARPPTGGDTDQLRAAAAGQCDIAVANTYYFGRLMNSSKDEDREVASKLGVIWPNQDPQDRGTHVNVSGVGITKHAKNREAAVTLIEYLLKPESQIWYAEVNNEYPVIDNVPISETLQSLGLFRADTVNLTLLGIHNSDAVKAMDRAGWK